MKSETAFLIDSDRVYFATYPRRAPHSPTSAITRLIQGVYAIEPEFARKILRNRIFSTAQATEMCMGMLRVAAKRLDDQVPEEEVASKISSFEMQNRIDLSQHFRTELSPLEKPQPEGDSPEAWMKLLMLKVKRSSSQGPRYLENRPIAAVLLSAQGELLSSALNTQSENKTLHAEVNLIQAFYEKTQRPIPKGAKIITTLKPCKMCAGMIWECAEDIESIEVFYGEMDLGAHARSTVLNPGSFERKRASKTPGQHSCVIEKALVLPFT